MEDKRVLLVGATGSDPAMVPALEHLFLPVISASAVEVFKDFGMSKDRLNLQLPLKKEKLEDVETAKPKVLIANHALRTSIQQLRQGKKPHIGSKQRAKGLKIVNKQKEKAMHERLELIRKTRTAQQQESRDANGDIQQGVQHTGS